MISLNAAPNALSSNMMIQNEMKKNLASRSGIRNSVSVKMSAEGSSTPILKKTYLSKLVNGGMRSKTIMQAATISLEKEVDPLQRNIEMGGLNGKALKIGKVFPQSKGEVYR